MLCMDDERQELEEALEIMIDLIYMTESLTNKLFFLFCGTGYKVRFGKYSQKNLFRETEEN